jgi:hypothetical protein
MVSPVPLVAQLWLLAEVGIGIDANATGIDILEYGICILVRYRSIPVPDWAPYRYRTGSGTGTIFISCTGVTGLRHLKKLRRKKGIHTCTCLHC